MRTSLIICHTPHQPENTISMVKHDSGTMILWGQCSSAGTVKLFREESSEWPAAIMAVIIASVIYNTIDDSRWLNINALHSFRILILWVCHKMWHFSTRLHQGSWLYYEKLCKKVRNTFARNVLLIHHLH